MAYNKSKLIRLEDYGFSKQIIDDINTRMDMSVTDAKDRLVIVNKILADYQEEFLNLNDKNISNLNKSDSLSEDSNLIKFLDRFGNYLDNSEDAKKEQSSHKRMSSKEIVYDPHLIAEVTEVKKGFYKPKDQKIFKEDYNHPEYGQILCDYQVAIYSLSKRLLTLREHKADETLDKETKKTSGREHRKIMSMIGDYKLDQIETKNRVGRLVEFNNLSQGHGGKEWFNFVNYGKSEDVKVCLVNCFGSVLTERGIVNYDMNDLIRKCNFTDEELEIMTHFRAGQTQDMISKELGKDQSTISSKIDKMVNKICKQYETDKYDNVRLNYIKGSYKRCIKCDEVKLDAHFYKGKNVCKPCHIKQQSNS